MSVIGSNLIKNRFYASLVHFTLSIVIVFFVVAMVFWVWYPGTLAEATGVTEIFAWY